MTMTKSPEKTKCDTHSSKSLEAYCMMCRELLCIDCILNDGHKNHDICAIEKAAEVEKSRFNDFYKWS